MVLIFVLATASSSVIVSRSYVKYFIITDIGCKFITCCKAQ